MDRIVSKMADALGDLPDDFKRRADMIKKFGSRSRCEHGDHHDDDENVSNNDDDDAGNVDEEGEPVPADDRDEHHPHRPDDENDDDQQCAATSRFPAPQGPVPYDLRDDDDPFYPREYVPTADHFFEEGDLGEIERNKDTEVPTDGLVYRQQEDEIRNAELGSDAPNNIRRGISTDSGCFTFWKSAHYTIKDPTKWKQAIKILINFADETQFAHTSRAYRVARSNAKKLLTSPFRQIDLRATADADDRNWEHVAVQWDNGWMAFYFNGVLFQATKFTPPGDKIFGLPARVGCRELDLAVRSFVMYSRRLSDAEIFQLSRAEIPAPTRFWETRLIKRGLVPYEAYVEDDFDSKYLFSPMPPPGEYPRMLFGKSDLPQVRELLNSTAHGRNCLETAEKAIDGLFAESQVFKDVSSGKSFRAHYKNPGKVAAYVEHFARFAFAHLLVDESRVTRRRRRELAAATLTIFREVQKDVEKEIEKVQADPRNKGKPHLWNHLSMVMGRQMLGTLLDFSGCFMEPEERKECEDFLVAVVSGLREIHTRWAPQGMDTKRSQKKVYETMKYRFHRRQSNTAIWIGCELFWLQMLVHGLPGSDPGDVYHVAFAFEMLNRSLNTELGSMVESQGKEAHWRGFLPWIAFMRLRLPHMHHNPFAHPQNRAYLYGKVFLCAPFTPMAMDHGSWAMSVMRPHLTMFAALFPNDPACQWYNRMVYRKPKQKEITEKQGRQGQWHQILPGEMSLYSPDPVPMKKGEKNTDRTFLRDNVPLEFSDKDIGFFVSHASHAPSSTSLYCYSQDLGGGHIKKMGGSFDVAGLETLWICAPAMFSVHNLQYATVTIDGKAQPGVNGSETTMYVGAQRSGDVAGCCIETTFAYRRAGKYIHVFSDCVEQDEHPPEPDSVNVKQSFRTMLTFRMGGDRSLILCIDDIVMNDDDEHEYRWHFNTPITHSIEERGPGEVEINGWGGEDSEFSHIFKKECRGAQCMVKVIDSGGVDANHVGKLFGFKNAGQSTPKDVFTEPHDDFNQVLSHTCAFSRRSKEGRFIVAIYPHKEGEELPRMNFRSDDHLIVKSPDRERKWSLRFRNRSDAFIKRAVEVEEHFTIDF